MAFNLGKATIYIGAKTAELRRKISALKGNLKSMLSGVGKIAGKVTGLLGPLGKYIGVVVAGLTALAAKLNTISERMIDTAAKARLLNMSASEYQRLGQAAEIAGVKTEQFFDATRQMTKNIGEALDGNEKYREAFARLGITLDDLRTKSPTEIFRQMAVGLQKIENQAQRNAAMFGMFGETGQILGATLLRTAEDFDQYISATKDAGTLTETNTENAKKYRVEMAKLTNQIGIIGQWIWDKLIPPMTEVVRIAGIGIKKMREWFGIAINPPKSKYDESQTKQIQGAIQNIETYAKRRAELIKQGYSDQSAAVKEMDRLIQQEIQLYNQLLAKQKEYQRSQSDVLTETKTKGKEKSKKLKQKETLLNGGQVKQPTYPKAYTDDKLANDYVIGGYTDDERLEQLKRLEEYGNTLEQSLINNFGRLAETGKLEIKDMVRSMLVDLAKLSIKQGIQGIFTDKIRGEIKNIEEKRKGQIVIKVEAEQGTRVTNIDIDSDEWLVSQLTKAYQTGNPVADVIRTIAGGI